MQTVKLEQCGEQLESRKLMIFMLKNHQHSALVLPSLQIREWDFNAYHNYSGPSEPTLQVALEI